MSNKNDQNSNRHIFDLAKAQMDQTIRSESLDRMVHSAVERGSKKVHTFRGSGYLWVKKLGPSEKFRVAYEIDLMFDSKLGREHALGSMIGDQSLLELAMSIGDAQLSYAAEGAPADIQIIQLEANRAYFTVRSGFGI
jgi:hypothetical protein